MSPGPSCLRVERDGLMDRVRGRRWGAWIVAVYIPASTGADAGCIHDALASEKGQCAECDLLRVVGVRIHRGRQAPRTPRLTVRPNVPRLGKTSHSRQNRIQDRRHTSAHACMRSLVHGSARTSASRAATAAGTPRHQGAEGNGLCLSRGVSPRSMRQISCREET